LNYDHAAPAILPQATRVLNVDGDAVRDVQYRRPRRFLSDFLLSWRRPVSLRSYRT